MSRSFWNKQGLLLITSFLVEPSGIMTWAIFGEEQDFYLCVRHLCSLHNHIVDLVKDPAEALVLRDQHLLVRLQLPDRDR